MTRNTRRILVATLTVLGMLGAMGSASGAVTWTPAANARTVDDPRTFNNQQFPPASRISGSTFGGVDISATSNDAAVNYTHSVGVSDGAGGAVDWQRLPPTDFPAGSYVPVYGALVPYAGNGMVPVNEAYTMAGESSPYWNGDCGAMRPHLQTDLADKYGAQLPTPLTGATASVTAGGLLTLTATEVARFDYLAIGDRIQTRGFAPAQYNRSAANTPGTGTGLTTNSYWTVVSRPSATSLTAQANAGTFTANSATVVGSLMRGSDCSRVIYTRTSTNGTSWDGGGAGSTNAFNVSAGPSLGGIKPYLSQTHVDAAQVATYGQYVYVVFTANNGYIADQCPNDPLVPYLRINSNYGAWDTWGPPILLTPSVNDQIAPYPQFTVDQANGHLYFLYQDANTMNVNFRKSTDNGANFSAATRIGGGQAKIYGNYPPPTDLAVIPNLVPTTVCNNSSTPTVGNGYRPLADDYGYGKHPVYIDAYNGMVGAIWSNNAAGDKVVAKISANGGTNWNARGIPGACTGAGPNLCSQVLTRSGAGGLCPNWGCVEPTPATCPDPFTAVACGTDTTLGAYYSVAAGPGTAGTTRIDFAWVNDSGVGRCITPGAPPNDTCTASTTPMGLYFQEWQSDATPADGGNWDFQRLVSCMRGAVALPAAPCNTKQATLNYGDFVNPRLAMWGTTGVGVTWHGCVYHTTAPIETPNTPCNNSNYDNMGMDPQFKDPGAEILYKESGNGGDSWGGEWGAASDYKVVANNNGPYYSAVNEWPDLLFDNPTDSANGCATQQVNGAPPVGCQRIVSWSGRNNDYLAYALYIARGMQT